MHLQDVAKAALPSPQFQREHLQDVAKAALPSPQFQRELLRFWSIRPVPASIPPEPAASAGLRQRAATHEREKFEQPIQRSRAIDPLPPPRQRPPIPQCSPPQPPRRNPATS